MEVFLFKKVIVWQKAMSLARLVYAVARSLPSEERYGLADQLRRAAASIPSNIAEGNGRASNKDYAHFLSIARGSLFETITQLQLASDIDYIDDYTEIEMLAAEVSRILTSMLQKYGVLQQKA